MLPLTMAVASRVAVMWGCECSAKLKISSKIVLRNSVLASRTVTT